MKKAIVFLCFFTISFLLFAQKGTIKGRIYDLKTNQPIEFANIIIKGTQIGSTSDLDGNYIFTGVEPGFIRLVVSIIGSKTTESAEIQVQGTQTNYVDIGLPEEALAIKEFVVRRI